MCEQVPALHMVPWSGCALVDLGKALHWVALATVEYPQWYLGEQSRAT